MKKSRLLLGGALVAAGALALSACGGRAPTASEESSPGITDDTVIIGSSFPLSGPLQPFGTNDVNGLQAFIDKTNADGGVKMADGKTRKIKFKYYDDAYDPAKSVQNFQRLADEDNMFAYVAALGTAPNLAVRPVANEAKIPQVFVQTGLGDFSSQRDEFPWTLGWQPSYENEATAFGEYLVSLNRPIKVAFLGQNDDFGKALLEGINSAIEGTDVEVVQEAYYESTDTTVDSQVSQLAASGADAFLAITSSPTLEVSALKKAVELGWDPITYIPSVSSGVESVVMPSGAATSISELFTSTVLRDPCAPGAEDDPVVTDYLATLKEFSPDADKCLSNTIYAYAAGDSVVRVLEGMTAPTRQAFMDSLSALKVDDIAMVQEGLMFDGSDTGKPPFSEASLLRFDGKRWASEE